MRLPIIYFLLISTLLHASVRQSKEQGVADELATSLDVYKRHVSSAPLESWAQLSIVCPGFIGLDAMLGRGSITEFFSIIPLSERNRFPLGNLIFVQSKAMPWPDIWKTEDPNAPGKFINHPRYQDIRFFVYEKDGKYFADRWYENKFQAMLAETGLMIPPPTPYYPPPPVPPSQKQIDAAKSLALASFPKTETPAAPTVATPPPAAPARAAPRFPNAFWWIIGAIAALVTVMLLVRRKKPKT